VTCIDDASSCPRVDERQLDRVGLTDASPACTETLSGRAGGNALLEEPHEPGLQASDLEAETAKLVTALLRKS
jgi:hypothetical protein